MSKSIVLTQIKGISETQTAEKNNVCYEAKCRNCEVEEKITVSWRNCKKSPWERQGALLCIKQQKWKEFNVQTCAKGT